MVDVASIKERLQAEAIGRVIYLGASMALIVILARLLTPTEYGLVFLTISTFSLAAVATELGIAKSAARFIAEYRNKDPSAVPPLVRQALFYTFIATIIVSMSFIVLSDYIVLLFGSDDPSAWKRMLLIGVLFLAGMTFITCCRLLFQGFENIRLAALTYGLHGVSRLVFVILFTISAGTALAAFMGYVVAALITASVGLTLLYYFEYTKYYDAYGDTGPNLRNKMLRYNVPLIATRSANKVDKEVDTILVGLFLTPTAVALYTISKQITQAIDMPASVLGFTISPTVGGEVADGEKESAAQLYRESLVQILLLYIPAAAGVILVAEQFIIQVFSYEYAGAVPVLQVMSIYMILQAITNITSDGLDYLGRAKFRAYAKGLTSIGNVILNILLIPTIGVVGAAVATVLTHTGYVSLNLWLMSHELSINPSSVLPPLAKIMLITGVMSLIVWGVLNALTGLGALALAICVGIFIWFISSLILDLFPMDINGIKRMFRLTS